MSSNLRLQDQLSIILLLMLDQSTSYNGTSAGRELRAYIQAIQVQRLFILHSYVTGFRAI
jgi:hypothetical protein